MKKLLLFAYFLGNLFLLGQQSAPESAALTFPNGDRIEGTPLGLAGDGILRWSSPLFLQEGEPFRIKSVDALTLPPLELSKLIDDKKSATVRFQKHIDGSIDELRGEILRFDDETVSLRTSFSDELTLKRSMLDEVIIDPKGVPLITGPGELDDWKHFESSNLWKIEETVIRGRGRGNIAREFANLPDRIHLSFTLEYEFQPYFRFDFFAKEGERGSPSTGYQMQIQQGPISFQRRLNGRSTDLNPRRFDRVNQFERSDSAQFDFYADRAAGKFALYIDGKQAFDITDEKPLKGGDWLHMANTTENLQSVFDFMIRSWDGRLPENSEELALRGELPEGEKIELVNGDTILGEVKAFEEDGLRIVTEFAEITVPLKRLSKYELTSYEKREEPRIYAGDVRAFFHWGGYVTLRLSELTADSITGYSQVFGEQRFDLSAFSKIQFNPYDEKLRKIRDGSS